MIRILILAGLLLVQSPDDAPVGSDGEGIAAHCDNYFTTPAAHRCKCGRTTEHSCDPTNGGGPADVTMDKHCSTYCKRQNCKCVDKCES